MKLSKLKCKACEGLKDKLNKKQIKENLKLTKTWEVINNHHLKKDFKFKNFVKALSFVNKIGKIAEKEGHHPEIFFGWGYAEVKIYTHALHGLGINDFILASKIDQIKV